jgi:hypothetical protein
LAKILANDVIAEKGQNEGKNGAEKDVLIVIF